ncbi:MAG: hypothetical protein HQM10_13415 [Candidatus Riflebacteria bacterium]|nr:hypothetical protein [Candidatus Riflebacteria bacterium]
MNQLKNKSKSCYSDDEISDIIENVNSDSEKLFLKHSTGCPSCMKRFNDYNMIAERSGMLFSHLKDDCKSNIDKIMNKIEELPPLKSEGQATLSEKLQIISSNLYSIPFLIMIIVIIIPFIFVITKNKPLSVPKPPETKVSDSDDQEKIAESSGILILESENIGSEIKSDKSILLQNERQRMPVGSLIALKLPSGGTIRIAGKSDFVLNPNLLLIYSGNIDFFSGEKNLPLTIKSPQCEIEANSGHIKFSVYSEASDVKVLKGVAVLKSSKISVQAMPGFEGTIKIDGSLASTSKVIPYDYKSDTSQEVSTDPGNSHDSSSDASSVKTFTNGDSDSSSSMLEK